jgi:hypothetical protein
MIAARRPADSEPTIRKRSASSGVEVGEKVVGSRAVRGSGGRFSCVRGQQSPTA